MTLRQIHMCVCEYIKDENNKIIKRGNFLIIICTPPYLFTCALSWKRSVEFYSIHSKTKRRYLVRAWTEIYHL